MAVAAHPLMSDGVGELAMVLPFDAVENRNAAEMSSFALLSQHEQAKRRDFYATIEPPLTGGSDAHNAGSVGDCYTVLECAPKTEAIRAAILEGRVRSCASWEETGRECPRPPGVLRIFFALDARMDLLESRMSAKLSHFADPAIAKVSIFPDPGIKFTYAF